mmetsp:Transcript_44648/g.108955  ORF Transcript_44648/g.108955 Transcript_44648/m.108955 type:complete len:229 (-) Transcript_44648:447-1133(-)
MARSPAKASGVLECMLITSFASVLLTLRPSANAVSPLPPSVMLFFSVRLRVASVVLTMSISPTACSMLSSDCISETRRTSSEVLSLRASTSRAPPSGPAVPLCDMSRYLRVEFHLRASAKYWQSSPQRPTHSSTSACVSRSLVSICLISSRVSDVFTLRASVMKQPPGPSVIMFWLMLRRVKVQLCLRPSAMASIPKSEKRFLSNTSLVSVLFVLSAEPKCAARSSWM